MEIISVTRGDHPSDPWRLSPSIKGMIPLRPAGLDRHEGEKLVGGYSTVITQEDYKQVKNQITMGAEVAGIFAPIEYDEFLQLRNRQV